MARDAQNQAKQTYQQDQNLTNSSEANANALYSQLVPTFSSEVSNPQGFGTKDMADMTTAAGQSTGGALGAATGQANRMAAANRNSGSFAPVLDEAARQAGRQNSQDVLGIKNANEQLKQNQRSQGIAGLSGLQGEQNNDVLSSLGLQTSATNSLVNAGNSGWFQNMLGFMNAAGNDATAASGFKS